MNVPATMKATSIEESDAPGTLAFEARDQGLFYMCPCGCRAEGFLPFRGTVAGQSRPSWIWDGNRDTPTLEPSIHRSRACGWHGHLRNGVFVKC